MSRGLFITGTDTGIGKTVVTAGILRWLRRLGVDAVPLKPVQTGAGWRGGELISPDLEFCLSVAGIRPALGEARLMSPYTYEPACSPHLAGRLTDNYAEIPMIVRCAEMLLSQHQAIVVEGAGGVLVPLNEKETMLDLMVALGYPVVLVARSGLGTINHTLLSLVVLRATGLNVLGVVFNHTGLPETENRFIEVDNPETIASFGGVRVLGKLRYFDSLNPEKLDAWQCLETDIPGRWTILEELNR
ncbi:MAG: dethiobiotin synthase [Chloroflexi bacterium]|nr:dethiobiotin synthase [Chloroflexota bacterium]